jgi:hypothetical protein
LEQLNSKLYNLYKNRNYRGTDERTLRHAWGRGEKNQDGAIKELRDLLCYYGFRKNWDDTLKQLGLEHTAIKNQTLQLRNMHYNDDKFNLKQFEESEFAKRIYVELITRKAAIPIDLEKDVIEEIYDSWYMLFCAIRNEIKELPINFFSNHSIIDSPASEALKVLNEILRPHLTEHQAKFRDWLSQAKKTQKSIKLAPQEFQKMYPSYFDLSKSMKQVNDQLLNVSKKFEEFCI